MGGPSQYTLTGLPHHGEYPNLTGQLNYHISFTLGGIRVRSFFAATLLVPPKHIHMRLHVSPYWPAFAARPNLPVILLTLVNLQINFHYKDAIIGGLKRFNHFRRVSLSGFFYITPLYSVYDNDL